MWNRLFPFLDNNYRSLEDPELRDRFEFILRWANPNTILDLGYYDGLIANELSARDFKVVAIDYIHRKSAMRLINGHNRLFVNSYAEVLPFEDNIFDDVVASHSLEHVLNVDSVLAEASRVLKPTGRILAIVPQRKGNKPTHLREFDKRTLEDTMSKYFRKLAYFDTVGEGHAYIGTPLNK